MIESYNWGFLIEDQGVLLIKSTLEYKSLVDKYGPDHVSVKAVNLVDRDEADILSKINNGFLMEPGCTIVLKADKAEGYVYQLDEEVQIVSRLTLSQYRPGPVATWSARGCLGCLGCLGGFGGCLLPLIAIGFWPLAYFFVLPYYYFPLLWDPLWDPVGWFVIFIGVATVIVAVWIVTGTIHGALDIIAVVGFVLLSAWWNLYI